MSLVCVGTVAFDSIETPFGKSGVIVGGAATYISLAASNFTDQCKIVSIVGDDFPKEFISKMEEMNINTDGLQVLEGKKSFYWAGKYHYDLNSRDTLDTQLNVLENFNPILPDHYQNCEFLMLGNLAPAVQMQVLDQLKVRPKLVVLDTMKQIEAQLLMRNYEGFIR